MKIQKKEWILFLSCLCSYGWLLYAPPTITIPSYRYNKMIMLTTPTLDRLNKDYAKIKRIEPKGASLFELSQGLKKAQALYMNIAKIQQRERQSAQARQGGFDLKTMERVVAQRFLDCLHSYQTRKGLTYSEALQKKKRLRENIRHGL